MPLIYITIPKSINNKSISLFQKCIVKNGLIAHYKIKVWISYTVLHINYETFVDIKIHTSHTKFNNYFLKIIWF